MSQGVGRGTLGLAVSRSAGVSTEPPATMSVVPVPAQLVGGEASASMVSGVQTGP